MSPKAITKANFEELVLKETKTVVLDFWAPWCGPCRMVGPILDEIAAERPDVKVCKVNVDEQFELAVRYQITSIPTILFFKEGRVARQAVGLHSKAQLEALIEECRK